MKTIKRYIQNTILKGMKRETNSGEALEYKKYKRVCMEKKDSDMKRDTKECH